MGKPSKPRRIWRPQVRLRTLIGLMVVVSLLCGAWVRYLDGFKRENQVAARLAKLGAQMERRPVAPLWIPSWLDRNLRHHVYVVDLSNGRFKPDDLEALTELPQLEKLRLNRSQINDAGMAYVGRCRSLRTISLWYTNVTDKGIAELKDLPHLERLDIHDTRVTGSAFADWPAMPSLTLLTLDGTKLSDEGLRNLAGKCPNLDTFTIHGTPCTGAGFDKWSPIPGVKKLVITGPQMKEQRLKQLVATFPNVETLHAVRGEVNDAGLAEIARLSKLTELYVIGTKVTATGLAPLRQTKLLRLTTPVDVDFSQLLAVHRDYFPQCTIQDVWCCGCMEISPLP